MKDVFDLLCCNVTCICRVRTVSLEFLKKC